MNRISRRMFGWLLFGVCLLGPLGFIEAHSVGRDPAAADAREGEEEGKGQKHELLFKVINSALLIGGLVFLLRKPMAEFFTQRSASIRKSLEEGRRALEASQAQLNSVEEKLRRLEEEIAAFKASASQEMEAEQGRLKQATAEEAEKILEFARAQMETAMRAAKLELKNYAAQEALALAEEKIRERLDDSSRRRLISQFIAKLEGKETKN